MAAEAVEGWLRDYDGYRGLLILTDEEGQRSQVITLWDTSEAEERARPARGAMRDQIAAQAGMAVEAFDVYDVPVCEVVREDDADGQ